MLFEFSSLLPGFAVKASLAVRGQRVWQGDREPLALIALCKATEVRVCCLEKSVFMGQKMSSSGSGALSSPGHP